VVFNNNEEEPAVETVSSPIDAETHAKYEEVKRGDLHIRDLQKLTVDELHQISKNEGLTDYVGLSKSSSSSRSSRTASARAG